MTEDKDKNININSPEYVREIAKKAEENQKLRKSLLEKFSQREVSIDELIKYSSNKPFTQIGRITALKLITMLPGWTQNNALSAFVSYGIPIDIKLRDIKLSPRNLELYKILLDSDTPVSWRKRMKAPEGWPWKGNVLETLKDINENDLPSEIARAVRYEFGKDSLISLDGLQESDDVHNNTENDNNKSDDLDDLDELDALLAEEDDAENESDIEDELDILLHEEDDDSTDLLSMLDDEDDD